MRKILIILLIAMSMFLGFGKFDPILKNAPITSLNLLILFFSFLCVFHFNLIDEYKKFQGIINPLFLILFTLFLSSLLYGPTFYDKSYFNIEFFILIIFFWILAIFFKSYPEYALLSLLAFSVSCSFVMYAIYSGLLPNAFNIINGRLLLFEENPNSTSVRMAISIITVLYFIVENPLNKGKWRFLLFILTPSLFLSVVQSGSRGSLLALILSILFIIFFSKISKKSKFVIGTITVIAAPFLINIVLSEGGMASRLQSFFNTGDLGARENIWQSALQIFYSNPILGVGEAGYFTEIQKLTGKYIDTHNLFLYLLTTVGIIGFFLFMLFIFKVIKKIVLSYKKGSSLPAILFLFIMLVAVKTGGALTYSLLWYVFAIIYSFNIKEKK